MYKSLLVTAALLLAPLPAFSQGGPRSEDRDTYPDRRDRGDLESMLRDLGEEIRGGIRSGLARGAAFLLRSGDATVAVRCDPRDSMRACVDATLTLLERARTAVPPGTTPPSGTTPPPR
jgi:hypothetical protein